MATVHYRFLWCTLAPSGIIDGLESLSEEGMQQGDTWGSAGFCIGLHPDVQWAHEQLQDRGCMTVFDMDDCNLAGPSDVVFQTATDLATRVLSRTGVTLNLIKCIV